MAIIRVCATMHFFICASLLMYSVLRYVSLSLGAAVSAVDVSERNGRGYESGVSPLGQKGKCGTENVSN